MGREPSPRARLIRAARDARSRSLGATSRRSLAHLSAADAVSALKTYRWDSASPAPAPSPSPSPMRPRVLSSEHAGRASRRRAASTTGSSIPAVAAPTASGPTPMPPAGPPAHLPGPTVSSLGIAPESLGTPSTGVAPRAYPASDDIASFTLSRPGSSATSVDVGFSHSDISAMIDELEELKRRYAALQSDRNVLFKKSMALEEQYKKAIADNAVLTTQVRELRAARSMATVAETASPVAPAPAPLPAPLHDAADPEFAQQQILHEMGRQRGQLVSQFERIYSLASRESELKMELAEARKKASESVELLSLMMHELAGKGKARDPYTRMLLRELKKHLLGVADEDPGGVLGRLLMQGDEAAAAAVELHPRVVHVPHRRRRTDSETDTGDSDGPDPSAPEYNLAEIMAPATRSVFSVSGRTYLACAGELMFRDMRLFLQQTESEVDRCAPAEGGETLRELEPSAQLVFEMGVAMGAGISNTVAQMVPTDNHPLDALACALTYLSLCGFLRADVLRDSVLDYEAAGDNFVLIVDLYESAESAVWKTADKPANSAPIALWTSGVLMALCQKVVGGDHVPLVACELASDAHGDPFTRIVVLPAANAYSRLLAWEGGLYEPGRPLSVLRRTAHRLRLEQLKAKQISLDLEEFRRLRDESRVWKQKYTKLAAKCEGLVPAAMAPPTDSSSEGDDPTALPPPPPGQEYTDATVAVVRMANLANLPAREMVSLLAEVEGIVEAAVRKHDVFRLLFANDTFVVVAGVHSVQYNHADLVADFALDVLGDVAKLHMPNQVHRPVVAHIGIHTGSLRGGALGGRLPRFHAVGPAIDRAALLAEHGAGAAKGAPVSRALVSEEVQSRLRTKYVLSRPKAVADDPDDPDMYHLKARRY